MSTEVLDRPLQKTMLRIKNIEFQRKMHLRKRATALALVIFDKKKKKQRKDFYFIY